MISVALVDDHDMVRSALARVLASSGDISVVGEAERADVAWEVVLKHRPQVVVTDLDLPGESGTELSLRLLERNPDQGILVLTYRVEPREVQQLIEAGVRGYVPKSATSEELALAIRAVAQGRTHFSPTVAAALAQAVSNKSNQVANPLSSRQTLILQRMSRGLTTREIADELCLSPKTVEKYRSEIFRRLNCKNQVQALEAARRLQLLH